MKLMHVSDWHLGTAEQEALAFRAEEAAARAEINRAAALDAALAAGRARRDALDDFASCSPMESSLPT